jgi:outer membrane protein TolC
MGLPANTPYDVGVPKVEMPVDQTFEAVETYLAKAQQSRPDLSAARAEAQKAGSHLRKVKAEGYPSLTGAAAVGRTYFDNRNLYGNTYSAGIYLRVPLFTGFSHQYNVVKAAADEDAARARLKGLEQRVIFEVWSSYHDLKTARQRVLTSEDLFRSASESHDVALGRYKAGVGSILDLLAAQGQLADARAQRVQAYADWYSSLAQLAHDTGALWVDDPVKKLVVPVAVEEKKP